MQIKKTLAASLSLSLVLGVPGPWSLRASAAVLALPSGLAAESSGASAALGAAAPGSIRLLQTSASLLDAPGTLSASPAALASAPTPLTAAPASALTATPVKAAADVKPEDPSSGASLANLSNAIAAGKTGPAADGGAAAVAKTFDNSDVKKKAGGIPLDWVDGMIAKKDATGDQSRRLQDIVQRVGFSKAATNREILQNHNDKYTVEIPMAGITNQKQSGRCWLFAMMNMIASTMVADKTVTPDFEFSENYLHFFNMLEKANSHLEEVSRKIYRRSSPKDFSSAQRRAAVIPQIGDGGWYEWAAFLVSKYGLVPKSAMGETISSEGTAVLLNELDDSLAATASEMLANAKQYKAGREPNRAQEIQERGRARVWKILVTHLGTPPARFDYRQAGKPTTEGRVQTTPATVKTYTPQEFARDFVKFDPKDYLAVASYPGKKENAVYEAKNSAIGKSAPGEPDFNVRFLNVGSDRLEKLAADAIKGGQPVWFAADVSNSADRETGIMHPRLYDRAPIYQFTPEEAAPALTRKQSSYFSRINPNHAMVLTGFDQPDQNGPIVKFKVENSWGTASGDKGIYHMYNEWFHQNVFEIIVHKRFLNDDETGLWHGKAHKLNGADWY